MHLCVNKTSLNKNNRRVKKAGGVSPSIFHWMIPESIDTSPSKSKAVISEKASFLAIKTPFFWLEGPTNFFCTRARNFSQTALQMRCDLGNT